MFYETTTFKTFSFLLDIFNKLITTHQWLFKRYNPKSQLSELKWNLNKGGYNGEDISILGSMNKNCNNNCPDQ